MPVVRALLAVTSQRSTQRLRVCKPLRPVNLHAQKCITRNALCNVRHEEPYQVVPSPPSPCLYQGRNAKTGTPTRSRPPVQDAGPCRVSGRATPSPHERWKIGQCADRGLVPARLGWQSVAVQLNAARDGERLAVEEAEKATQEAADARESAQKAIRVQDIQDAQSALESRLAAAEADARAAPDALEHQNAELRALESRAVRAEATADTMSKLVTQLRKDRRAFKPDSRRGYAAG